VKLDDDTTREDRAIQECKKRCDAVKTQITGHGVTHKRECGTGIREVTVTVHLAADQVDLKLEFAYLISQCSWRASYDVRVSTFEVAKEKTQLTYYGIIVSLVRCVNINRMTRHLLIERTHRSIKVKKIGTMFNCPYRRPRRHWEVNRRNCRL
jgi:hypothetical protein